MKTFIIKFGTESLLNNRGRLCNKKICAIARQVSKIQKNYSVIIVSSGAIQAGKEISQELSLETKYLHKKDLAGIGSIKLLKMWGAGFAKYNIPAAQVWVTHANIQHTGESKSILTSLKNYLKSGVIPIINENDVVSSREIEMMESGISENDHLTRLITKIIHPQLIMFVTSSGGVFNKDPNIFKDAQMFTSLNYKKMPHEILDSIEQSKYGNGGIGKKLKEAAKCYSSKRRVAIADFQNNNLLNFSQGKNVGTLIDTKTSL